jgi:hypothetical protein
MGGIVAKTQHQYVVQLRNPELFLAGGQKWTDKIALAVRFNDIRDAIHAAGDYDVIYRTLDSVVKSTNICRRCGARRADHIDYGRPQLVCPTVTFQSYEE